MAGEMGHGTVASADNTITKLEWEGVSLHRFASAAAGDMGYDNGTSFVRLAIGSTNDFLQIVGDIPAWVTNPILSDDSTLIFGTGSDAVILYETADANAKALVFGLPHTTEDANNVPIAIFGDKDIINVNLGFFDGITQPAVAVVDADRDSFTMLTFRVDDRNAIIYSGFSFEIKQATIDQFLRFTTSNSVATLFGIGAYLRIGDAATTSHSLNVEDDLMVSGRLEVDGTLFIDGEVQIEGNPGIDFNGAITNLTVINGIVTAAS